jgi:two-component system, cell cycle sensor histidine kinase and response regulator CckA
MDQELRRLSLKWKIGGFYAGIMLVVAVFVLAATYQVTKNMLREQLDRRALAITNTLSDAAAGHIAGKNSLALNTLARKYTLLEGVAYAFIEDSRGNVVAHTLGAFPQEIQPKLPMDGQRQIHRRKLSLAGKTVYETEVPVLDGQLGSVHVGFWADVVRDEIQSALFPLIGIIAFVSFAGSLSSFVLAHWIVRPIVGLTEIADKVTLGDLETSVTTAVKSGDEIGDLARSLERMRSSLKAAMLRLGREIT